MVSHYNINMLINLPCTVQIYGFVYSARTGTERNVVHAHYICFTLFYQQVRIGEQKIIAILMCLT